MIINSNFKDYYDFLAHQYRDEKIVYNRENIEYNRENKNKTPKDLVLAKKELSFEIVRTFGAEHRDERVDCLLIGGKVYQYHFKDMGYDVYCRKKIEFKNKEIKDIKRGDFYFFKREFREYGWGEFVPKFNDLCVKYAPVIWFNGIVVLNPIFRGNEKIMKVLDPYNMVQDIMACIGSVEPHIPEMDNKTKIESAGFDVKKSFRPNINCP